MLVSGGTDRVGRVWSYPVVADTPKLELGPHNGTIEDIDISSDERYVLKRDKLPIFTKFWEICLRTAIIFSGLSSHLVKIDLVVFFPPQTEPFMPLLSGRLTLSRRIFLRLNFRIFFLKTLC